MLDYPAPTHPTLQQRGNTSVPGMLFSRTSTSTFQNETSSAHAIIELENQEEVLAKVHEAAAAAGKGWRFWLIYITINIATLLVAVDLSIVSTALPTIAADLNARELFVWVANAYVLASSAVQPLFGQAANIFGRRSLTILAICLFLLGSALAGAATTITMMIAARSIQGIGGGGIVTLGEIIISDLLPLRERGQYTGILAGTYAVGTVIGRKFVLSI